MINVKVDGTFLLTTAVLGLGLYAYSRRGDIASAINPTSENNLINEGVKEVVGEENVQGAFDVVFATGDLLNPFTPPARRQFAKQVLFGE